MIDEINREIQPLQSKKRKLTFRAIVPQAKLSDMSEIQPMKLSLPNNTTKKPEFAQTDETARVKRNEQTTLF